MFNCPKYAQPTKIYHPITFDIPKDELPEINFYGINIKNITEIDLKFLAESNENKRSIQIIMETIEKLKSSDGIHHLVFASESQTESLINANKSGVKYRSDKADDFFTKTKIGTEKTASEIVAYFKPFLKDYCLLPANNPHNLNMKEIMNDSENYHIFSTKWITSRREKAFFILHILQELINNEHHAKHPICIILEEIRFLVPASSGGGYIDFLAEEIKSTMTRMRNMGKGFAIISTTQVYRDVHNVVMDSFTENIFGKISSLKELEFIGKAQKLSSTDMNTIKNLDVGEFAIFTKEEGVDERSLNKVRFFMPPHSHKEQGKNFFDEYQKLYPEKMHNYTDLIEEIKAEKQRIEEEVIVLKDKENIHKKEQSRKQQEAKQPKNRDYETEKQLENSKEKNKKTSQALENLIWETWTNANGKDKELGSIALKLGLILKTGAPNKMAVSRLLQRHRDRLSEPKEEEEETEEESEEEDETTA